MSLISPLKIKMDQETGGKKSVMYIRERGNRDPDAAFHYE